MMTSLRRFSTGSLLAVGVLLAALRLTSGEVNAVESVAIPVPQSTCVDCASPEYCGPDEHDAWNNPNNAPWHRNGGAHSGTSPCFDGSCDTMHGPFGCTEMFDDPLTRAGLEALRQAIHRNDAAGLNRILASHADQVRLNRQRAAIQVASCVGTIAIHLPVAPDLVRQLGQPNH